MHVDSGYSVLVATDAVGLGLNLNIRRIVFTSLKKPNKVKIRSRLAVSLPFYRSSQS